MDKRKNRNDLEVRGSSKLGSVLKVSNEIRSTLDDLSVRGRIEKVIASARAESSPIYRFLIKR